MGGEPGVVGRMYRRVVREGSREVVYRHALVEALPDQILTFHSESQDFTSEATYHYKFSAEGEEHTWLVVQAITPSTGLAGLLARLVPFLARRRIRGHIGSLRDGAEASVAPG